MKRILPQQIGTEFMKYTVGIRKADMPGIKTADAQTKVWQTF
jgi:hypothetical protein